MHPFVTSKRTWAIPDELTPCPGATRIPTPALQNLTAARGTETHPPRPRALARLEKPPARKSLRLGPIPDDR